LKAAQMDVQGPKENSSLQYHPRLLKLKSSMPWLVSPWSAKIITPYAP